MKAYIDEHGFDWNFSGKKLKADLGLGNNNVVTQFQAVVGRSPKEYAELLRMERAAELLSTELPIHRIAASVGYVNPETFCGAFQRLCGVTPSVHRGWIRAAAGQSQAALPVTAAQSQNSSLS